MQFSWHLIIFTLKPRLMLTVDYLSRVLPEIREFSDSSKLPGQILSGEGFDGIIAILENLRTSQFPCVILEDKSIGSIDIDAGPVDSYSISLWVMLQGTEISKLYNDAFSLGTKILKKLVRDADTEPELQGLDSSHITYMKRSGAMDCYGYEFLITFKDNIDLSDE